MSSEIIRINRSEDNAIARSLRTSALYIPGLFGQWKVWDNRISIVAQQADKIIQLGNIIGFNDEIVEKKDGIRSYNSVLLENIINQWAVNDNWVQIIGPNEIIALTDRENNFIDPIAAKTLREAYFSNKKSANFKIAYAYNNRLFTNGGLTHGEWVKIGKPNTAEEAAHKLNKKYDKALYFGDSLRTGGPPMLDANPVFCDDIHELYPSWLYAQEQCPFEQVFASSMNSLRGTIARNSELSPLYWIDDSCIDLPRIGSIIRIRDTQFFGLDVNLNKEAITTLNTAWKLWLEESYGPPKTKQ